jgi:DNA-binding NarL/FixJ family response regulator
VGDEAQVRALAAEARAVASSRRMVRVLRLLDQAVGEPGAARPAGLTERETEVLRLLGEGLSNREISRRLTISENTAANHVRNILIKTGCANRTKAAMFAVEAGLMA